MKILTLSIKQTYFDEIKAGTKKTETREIRPGTSGKYIEYLYKGKRYAESEVTNQMAGVEAVPKKYDAIKFLTGAYEGTRPSMLVEVKDAKINILVDENGQEIVFEWENNEYVAAEIVYTLGAVIG